MGGIDGSVSGDRRRQQMALNERLYAISDLYMYNLEFSAEMPIKLRVEWGEHLKDFFRVTMYEMILTIFIFISQLTVINRDLKL